MARRIAVLGMVLLVVAACNQPRSNVGSAPGERGMKDPGAQDPQVPAALQESDDEDEGDEPVSLADVPAAAKAAALAAVPGLVLEEGEKEGPDQYCLHGTAGGTFYEVEVSSTGEVGEIEAGPDDEDD